MDKCGKRFQNIPELKSHVHSQIEVWKRETGIQNFLRVFLMITLAPRQKILSQIAIACTVAFIFEASKLSKITRHTAEPRNRVQLVMNNTVEAKSHVVLPTQGIACSW